MAEVLALLPDDPKAVGPYRLEGRLGVGGQGTVYVGRDGSGGFVAVKLLHPHLMADQRAQQRFLREVATAKRPESHGPSRSHSLSLSCLLPLTDHNGKR
ncbi:hypothetical protein ACQEVF_23820 [Nonomuraea polychroma]|uniref:hypothetical protein n=1 Tax=Nonomuraea polychroma TaxID=46176 RepID=UPI003D91439E